MPTVVLTECGDVQVENAEPSKLHSNRSTLSGDSNEKVRMVLIVGEHGADVIEVSGGTVSIVQEYEAGVESQDPDDVQDRTLNVLVPSERFEYVLGDVQEDHGTMIGPRRHWKFGHEPIGHDPPLWNENDAVVEFVSDGGAEEIVVSQDASARRPERNTTTKTKVTARPGRIALCRRGARTIGPPILATPTVW